MQALEYSMEAAEDAVLWLDRNQETIVQLVSFFGDLAMFIVSAAGGPTAGMLMPDLTNMVAVHRIPWIRDRVFLVGDTMIAGDPDMVVTLSPDR
jgi:hypothetical protein